MSSQDSSPRILIVDDHPMIRMGLRLLIEAKTPCTVCGEAETADETMKQIRDQIPELTILDISLGSENGIDIANQIRESHPAVKILIHSLHEEDVYAKLAYRAGACGFVHKGQAPTHLINAIETVLKGDLFFSESIIQNSAMDNSARQRIEDDCPLDMDDQLDR